MKKRIVKITAPHEVAEAYRKVKDKIDYPVLMHDKWAFESFLKNEGDIDWRLAIDSFSSQAYIKRDAAISVYITDDLLEQLGNYAKKKNVKRNTVMIQAIKNYCIEKDKEFGLGFQWSF